MWFEIIAFLLKVLFNVFRKTTQHEPTQQQESKEDGLDRLRTSVDVPSSRRFLTSSTPEPVLWPRNPTQERLEDLLSSERSTLLLRSDSSDTARVPHITVTCPTPSKLSRFEQSSTHDEVLEPQTRPSLAAEGTDPVDTKREEDQLDKQRTPMHAQSYESGSPERYGVGRNKRPRCG